MSLDMRVIDNFLPEEQYKSLLTSMHEAPMTYGARSNRETDPHGHWSWKPIHDKRRNLADLDPFISGVKLSPMFHAWNAVRRYVSPDVPHKLIRAYVNGYTFGTDGYFHTDSDRGGETTAILYLCDKWERDWAGETVVEESDDYGGVLPAPNRLLLFPSDAPHCARSVSRKCPVLRSVLVFKMRPARSDMFEKLSSWLADNGALKVDHGADSLHDHLMRVYQLLEDRGEQLHVCLGGGLHSIYGTNSFKTQLLKPDSYNRARVAATFGQRAEALAYMFSVLDRPATLNVHDGGRLQLSYDQWVEVHDDMARPLRLIECANLYDQNSLEKWPRLKELWDGLPGKKAGEGAG